MTALGHSPVAAGTPGRSLAFPLNRALAVEADELLAVLVASPKTRLAHAAAWPVFGIAISVGFVGAHFGKPSYAAHALAVFCLLIRFLPGIRARASVFGARVIQVTLNNDGIRIEAAGEVGTWTWAQASYFESPLGLALLLSGRALPCLLSPKHFSSEEYAALVELLQRRVRRTPRGVDFSLLAAMLLFALWVAWRTWSLST